jgi:hypothetical protein
MENIKQKVKNQEINEIRAQKQAPSDDPSVDNKHKSPGRL